MWYFFVFFLYLLAALTGCSNIVSVETECNPAGQMQERTIVQDKRAKIMDYLNREILIRDAFAGQSITLIEENGDYFVLRKFFGSGVPVVRSIKYKTVFYSDWQIRFPETTDASHSEFVENFILAVNDKGLILFFNGLQVVIEE